MAVIVQAVAITHGAINMEDAIERVAKHYKGVPFKAVLELTKKCNFQCFHCFNRELTAAYDGLSLNEWKTLLKALKSEGCRYLALTGGEPTQNLNFKEIYTEAHKNNFYMSLMSNGAFDKSCLETIRNKPPKKVCVSLYGFSEESYERCSSAGSMFRQVCKNVNELAAASIPVSLRYIVMNSNKNDLLKANDFAQKLHVPIYFAFRIFPTLSGDKSALKEQIGLEDELNLLRRLGHARGIFIRGPVEPKKCLAGISSCFIDCSGNMSFCQVYRPFSYDLRSRGLKECWALLESAGTKLQRYCEECAECEFRSVCSVCVAFSEYVRQSIPHCLLRGSALSALESGCNRA